MPWRRRSRALARSGRGRSSRRSRSSPAEPGWGRLSKGGARSAKQGHAGHASRTGLTARERDVVRLVAAGHTNREIGDQLFISEKTVSVHVSNAMAKLGALSRYEAAAAAERQGLL